jgi:hypothetical protein
MRPVHEDKVAVSGVVSFTDFHDARGKVVVFVY